MSGFQFSAGRFATVPNSLMLSLPFNLLYVHLKPHINFFSNLPPSLTPTSHVLNFVVESPVWCGVSTSVSVVALVRFEIW